MQYADILIAILGVLALAWAADLLTGKRGFGGTVLVAAVGAACGWFLPIRVFGVTTMTDWSWVAWSLSGATLCLAAYFLLRSKR